MPTNNAQENDDFDEYGNPIETFVPEVVFEVRYKEPVELLTKAQIEQLKNLGYDMKTIYYSTYEEIRKIRLKLEQMELNRKLDAAIADSLEEIEGCERANLEATEDMRDMMADDIVRKHAERCDAEARRYEYNGPSIWFKLALMYVLMATTPTAMFLAQHSDPSYGREGIFFFYVRIFCPYLNLIYPATPENTTWKVR
jgi:hypothetical protein